MPNILLEMMASSLPIVCSNRGPMLEILGHAGFFFDPLSPSSIQAAIHRVISSPLLRAQLSSIAFDSVQKYTWKSSADNTFKFFSTVLNDLGEDATACVE